MTKPIVEKTDVYGLGMTMLQCVCQPSLMTMLLYLPIEDTLLLQKMRGFIKSFPILSLIYEMIRPEPKKRPGIDKVISLLKSCPAVEQQFSRELFRANVFLSGVFTYQDNYYGLETVEQNVQDG